VAALGGGILRDLAIDAVPPLAFADWRYAVTALGGAILVTILHGLGLAGPVPAVAAAVLITGVRLLALYRRWSAPIPVR
jgi:uncharacterized membrane protein YeiH